MQAIELTEAGRELAEEIIRKRIVPLTQIGSDCSFEWKVMHKSNFVRFYDERVSELFIHIPDNHIRWVNRESNK